ncbi:MAG: flagellar export protein FliJ [Spirochaetia bacterium]
MRRFHFRLDRLLRIKAHTEQEWEIKLGKATSECLSIERRIDDALKGMASTFHQIHTPERHPDMNFITSAQRYMDRLSGRVDELEDELVVKEAERREVQEGYLEASKERKVLDKLKERRGREFYKAERDEEYKVLDDINTGSYIRNRLEEA